MLLLLGSQLIFVSRSSTSYCVEEDEPRAKGASKVGRGRDLTSKECSPTVLRQEKQSRSREGNQLPSLWW